MALSRSNRSPAGAFAIAQQDRTSGPQCNGFSSPYHRFFSKASQASQDFPINPLKITGQDVPCRKEITALQQVYKPFPLSHSTGEAHKVMTQLGGFDAESAAWRKQVAARPQWTDTANDSGVWPDGLTPAARLEWVDSASDSGVCLTPSETPAKPRFAIWIGIAAIRRAAISCQDKSAATGCSAWSQRFPFSRRFCSRFLRSEPKVLQCLPTGI